MVHLPVNKRADFFAFDWNYMLSGWNSSHAEQKSIGSPRLFDSFKNQRLGEGSEWPCKGNYRSERPQGPLCSKCKGESQEAPRRSWRAGCGGETQGRSGWGEGRLLGEPWANNGLIKERVRVGRSRAGPWPVNLLSPTLANGAIVLCCEGAGALAWELPGACPEGRRRGHSFFAWPQNGSSVLGR